MKKLSFIDYVFNRHHTTINANDLRIVKLYSVVHEDFDECGRKIGTESAKVFSNYILVQKIGKMYRVIPTHQFQTNMIITDRPTELHELFIKKTNKRNRYKKPIHFCEELENRTISISDAKAFAEIVSKVNISSTSDELIDTETNKLKKVCVEFNKYLDNEKSLENEEQYII